MSSVAIRIDVSPIVRHLRATHRQPTVMIESVPMNEAPSRVSPIRLAWVSPQAINLMKRPLPP